jgi:hypothetical protein
MDNKKGLNFFFIIIAIITGGKVYKHFDFQNLKFERPILDIIYLITFVATITFLINDFLKQRKK